ncbi:DUF6625 family protein [Formosa sp. A9]|uniref:DUF6625 family protein n=1 Tax=Formosa sp. A9 TaxID=3442641 RepID=UPI003EBAFD6F
MTSIILIIPYFGKWPLWFGAYLKSCAANPSIHWLCPTDCDIPVDYPSNIRFLPVTLAHLNQQVNKIVGVEVPLSPRKFCDLKPAYGDIFKAQLVDFDFWGICDMDIIWGDIRKFITGDLLNQYDIISSRKHAISGHFTLFKNTPSINTLYKQLPNIKALYSVPEFKWTDEHVLTKYLKSQAQKEVYWPNILCNQERGRDSHQEYYLDRWQWQDGKVVNTKTNTEVMYLHFINWKRTMRYSEVQYTDPQTTFYISYSGMHYQAHSLWQQLINKVKNVFNGFYVILRRKQRIKKLKKKLGYE